MLIWSDAIHYYLAPGATVVIDHLSDGCSFVRMCTTQGFKCPEVQYSDLALRCNANIVRTVAALATGMMKTFITHRCVYG